MKAKIEKINDRVRIEFTDLDVVESLLMQEYVNASTKFTVNELIYNKHYRAQFTGQGVVRFTGASVRSGVTERICFESPFKYNKDTYKYFKYSFKKRIKILLTGRI